MLKVLIIGFVWPEPKSSAAGSRMMQIIKTLQSENFSVLFATTCAKSANAYDLKSLNIRCEPIVLNDSSFDKFIQEELPDFVVFDRFMTEEQFGWRVAENCPNTVRILDTEDLHFLRKGRQQAIKDGSDFQDDYLINDVAKREIASIYRCDLSLIISEYEIELLVNKFKVDPSILLYLPFLVESISNSAIETLPAFNERSNFITIGNFLHPPNVDAVDVLKASIWPEIRSELPDAEIHIYGAYISDRIQQLHNTKEGFIIKGYAEDANLVIQNARVTIAPLRFGAGLKGKLLDAMINGTPMVTTSIGAEGIYGNHTPTGYITDDFNDFARKAAQLYLDEKRWKEFQSTGFEILKERFSSSQIKRSFIERINRIRTNLVQHRQQNFVGIMLQHHSLQSSKFMSRWIEEKNKN